MEEWCDDTGREKTEVLREKPAPLPICPPKTMHGLVRDQTRANTVRSRRLAASSEEIHPPQHKFIFCPTSNIIKISCVQEDYLTVKMKTLEVFETPSKY
jgi:hypothetical protein